LFQKNTILYGLSTLYAFLTLFFVWNDQAYFSLASLGLLAIFAAIFYTDWTFLFLAFATPLSINIEEYTEGFGLFLPTEPLLFGLMVLLIFLHIQKGIFPMEIWKNPIIWAVSFYFFWVLITSVTSSAPLTSFKFLLSHLWLSVPLLLYGPVLFQREKNIRLFLWLFSSGMMIAIGYTVVVHASYGFGEKEGHWVMWPFFKDHTIYGAMVAFTVPMVLGLYVSKKHSPLVQLILICFILLNLLGLYFSYTRAAWLSVVAAMGVWALIHFRVRFSILSALSIVLGLFLYFSWDAIQIDLSRNKLEHTTEEFGEKLQSAANVSTDASNLERLNRWACALSMFQERPIFGFGPGTYAFEYARFQEPENTTIISTSFGDAGNAHSEYLGPLAEMGLPGLVAVILIVVAIFYKGITLYYQWPASDKEMKIIILGMILSLVTYFVHAFLNNFLDTDKAAVPIWGFCAAFIALERKVKAQRKPEINSI
jgi:putative inorganic carbon (hco3(-)) transporter